MFILSLIKFGVINLTNIAIIPARGGSKRIPLKNIKDFLGEPIIQRVLKEIHSSDIFDQIIVSTDDEVIRQVVENMKFVDIHNRPSSLSDDFTGTQAVIQSVCNELNLGDQDNICCIYPTAALIKAETLHESLLNFTNSDADFLFSAKRFEHPVQRGFCINDKSKLTFVEETHISKRTQDLTEMYFDAGYFYWGSGIAWKEARSIISPANEVHIYGALESYDIDERADWAIVEKLARILG